MKSEEPYMKSEVLLPLKITKTEVIKLLNKKISTYKKRHKVNFYKSN